MSLLFICPCTSLARNIRVSRRPMMNLGVKRLPLIGLSITVFFLLLVIWYSYNSQLAKTLGGTSKVSGYEEARIQKWIQESEVIWQRGIASRSEAEKVSKPEPSDPWTPWHYRNIWDFFYPTYNCPHTVERLGRLGDGGKWVCGISHFAEKEHPCVVFSYGISDDTSFEADVLNRTNCFVYAYDHTVKPDKVALTKLYPTRSMFTKLGIGTENKGFVRTLKAEMDHHGKEFIDILKIDVEGAEYSLLPQILKDFPNLPVGQLLIEIHLDCFPQNDLYKSLKDWWTPLENAGLRPFRAEPNLIALLRGSNNHPTYYEISFLNVQADHVLLHG